MTYTAAPNSLWPLLTTSNPRLLGGSASHAAVAAGFFGPTRMGGVVGKDFPKRYLHLYERHGIDLEGLQIKEGKTFHWSGEYEQNMNRRRTLATPSASVSPPTRS